MRYEKAYWTRAALKALCLGGLLTMVVPSLALAHDSEREARRQALRDQLMSERDRAREAGSHGSHSRQAGSHDHPHGGDAASSRRGSAAPGLSPEARRALRDDLRQHQP